MFFWVVFTLHLFTQFVISIDISKCPPLRLPTNGYVVCDHLIGAFCAPVCNPGFVPETQPAQAYVCNPLRNAWATYPGGYPLPWPNCIRSTKQDEAAKAESATKKSKVGQQAVKSIDQQVSVGGKESLWQRMLSLTSQLTQSKLKEDSGGAARSLQSPSSSSSSDSLITKAKNKNDDSVNGNNNLIGSENSLSSNNLNLYGQTTPYSSYQNYASPTQNPTQSENEKKVQYRRLQQYWDEYYKRYYESIGKGKLPEWMMRSPWSNDPEQVQGALDTDMYNLVGSPENNTAIQNLNRYVQNYYLQYPRPDANVTGADQENLTQPPNSSSDAFIDNVIENDLESKSMLDKSLNRDLYYEDQLIHKEEKKRPRLNFMNYIPTTHSKANGSTTVNNLSNNTARPYPNSPYAYQVQNSSKNNYQYNTTPNTYVTGQQSSSLGRNASGSSNSSQDQNATTPGYNSEVQDTHNSSKNNSLQNSYASSSTQNDTAPMDPYERYTQYFKDYYKKVQNSSRVGIQVQPSTGVITQDMRNTSSGNVYSTSNQTESSVEATKTPKQNHLANLLKSVSKDDVTNQTATAFVPGDDSEDDGTDYLDQLDISALVRELIKLETIRKERKLARKKHLQREQSREAVNLAAGDLMRGYFRTKIEPPQKGLKKHLLHKVRRLMKFRPNQSPLPKFNT